MRNFDSPIFAFALLLLALLPATATPQTPQTTLIHQARKVPNPLVVNIRVDSSDDGKTWMLQTQTNVFTSLGSTLSVEMSDSEKSTRLLLSSRLLPDVTQGRDKAK